MKRFFLITAVVILIVLASTLAVLYGGSDGAWLASLYGSEADRQAELRDLVRENKRVPMTRLQVDAEAHVREIMAARRAAWTPGRNVAWAPAPAVISALLPTATPDIQATITAAVAAALAAQSEFTPEMPTPTPTDTPAPIPDGLTPAPELSATPTPPQPTGAPTVTLISKDEAIIRLKNYFDNQMFLEFDRSVDGNTHAISNQRFIFWLARSEAVLRGDGKENGHWLIEVTYDDDDVDSPPITESWFVFDEAGQRPSCDKGKAVTQWAVENSCSIS